MPGDRVSDICSVLTPILTGLNDVCLCDVVDGGRFAEGIDCFFQDALQDKVVNSSQLQRVRRAIADG